MATRTGNGGFNIDGLTYTFDVVEEGEEGIAPIPSDSGDIVKDNKKRDLSKGTKETLGRYLSRLTQENQFKLDAEFVDSSITTPDGEPISLSESQNSDKFVSKETLNSRDQLKQMVSGQSMTPKVEDPQNDLLISKGKSSSTLDNGHDVLRSVVGGDQLPSSISGYTTKILSNNRFTSLNQSANAVNLRTPTEHNPTLFHPKYGNVSMNRLAQIGALLSIRSSQEPGSSGDGVNPSSGAQNAQSILPGFNQLGVERINTTLLEAKDVLDTLTTEEIPDGNFVSATPGGSWGNMNNVHDPYSGLSAVGMIALAAALTAGVVVMFEGLGFVLSLIKGGNASGPARNIDGRYVLGRYFLEQGPDPNAFPPTSFPPDIGASLGIRPTIHPFSEALQVGVTTFFGINTSAGLFGQITSGLESATSTPQYNAIIARTIIRANLTIIDRIKDTFNSSNVVAGVDNILSVVDTLRSSKLISALNVFASLGDQFIFINKLDERVPGLIGEPMKHSKMDRLADSAQAVQKNRLNNTLKLAWASNRTPSSYLIPEPVLSLSTTGKLGAPNIIHGQSSLSKTYYRIMNLSEQTKTTLRIPYDSNDPDDITVKSIEGRLDGEYMPFYFHDLRTNEIISFHAFLTQLSDDFTPNWDTTDGFGRVDPVHVYKNTGRRINLGFIIAATSDEDFSDMWMKINKLVTLVYPQYTAGRLLTDAEGNNQIVQPFSQMISASPLIRLRLGELFSSNSSRFALSRLFGADSNLMKINGEELRFSGATDLLKKLSSDLNNPSGKTYVLSTNNMSRPDQTGIVITLPTPKIPGLDSVISSGETAPKFMVAAGDIHYFTFKVVKELDSQRVIVTPSFMQAKTIQDFFGFSSKQVESTMTYLRTEYDNTEKPGKRVIGGQYVASKVDLRISPDRFKTIISDASLNSTNVDQLSDFLNHEKNAVIKSFREVGGKGLAGKIDSMNFDYFNNVTWEITPGRRAPQLCRVTLGFTPVHDISPGLDHLGFNRAPVYPVGNLAHGFDNDKGS